MSRLRARVMSEEYKTTLRVIETTTCCAYREYPKYVLPEDESDDIQIPISNCTRQIWDHKVVQRKTVYRHAHVDHQQGLGTLFSVIRQNT